MNVTGAATYNTSYIYDKNNRLITEAKVTGGLTETTRYSYDDNGNQKSKITENLKPASGAEASSISVSGDNITSNDVTLNEYDGFNQLKKTTTGNNSIDYNYDATGLRVSKTVNGVITNSVWDGDQVDLEVDGAGKLVGKYIRGINLLSVESGAGVRKYYMFNGHSPTFFKYNGEWRFLKDNKVMNVGIGVLGFVPFADNAFWSLGDYFSGTKTVSVSDYNSYISGSLGVLGNLSKLGKIAKISGYLSTVLTTISVYKEFNSDSCYMNDIASQVFDGYYQSKSFETAAKRLALYSTITLDLVEKKVITYTKDFGIATKIKINWTKFDEYFKQLGMPAADLGKSIK